MLSNETGQATPARNACNQLAATTHHWSPGESPGKPTSGAGVTKSFPCDCKKPRNSAVTWAHTVCEPRSERSVLHEPSRNQPVLGWCEQGANGWPKTLSERVKFFPSGSALLPGSAHQRKPPHRVRSRPQPCMTRKVMGCYARHRKSVSPHKIASPPNNLRSTTCSPST